MATDPLESHIPGQVAIPIAQRDWISGKESNWLQTNGRVSQIEIACGKRIYQ